MRLRPGDIDALVLGATLLGSGGGGDPSIWAHRLASLTPGEGIELLTLDDAHRRGLLSVVPVGVIGATAVLAEKLPRGDEIGRAVEAAQRWSGHDVDALIPVEAAGLNAVLAVAASAELSIPLIDVDLMGRALPRFDQLSLAPTAPGLLHSAALAEPTGQVLLLDDAPPQMLERAARAYVSVAGGWVGAAFGPVQLDQLTGRCCPGTLRRAVDLGHALLLADDPDPAAVALALGGRVLGSGRVVEVARSPAGHPNRASVTITDRTGPVVRIEAENEYLLALVDGWPVVSCPELILVMDRRTARPISVDRLRVGDDVQALALPGPPWWWEEPTRLAAVAPRAFGIDSDPIPLSIPDLARCAPEPAR